MNTRAALSLSLSALALGGTMVGCTGGSGGGIASAGSSSVGSAKGAAGKAAQATKALAKHDGDAAVSYAEAAVQLAPRQADYRVTLGQSYMQAGRFESALAAFADALSLAPGNGKAALNLALAETATGDWAGARRTLAQYQDAIPVSDRGLALALAGDPAGAVDVLVVATRSPGADAKTRQNLALALALAGRWQEAKTVGEVDIGPDKIDQRIIEWAAFARPASKSDQVAALLGVTPAEDHGMPVALALNAPVSNVAVAAASEPVVAAAAPVQVTVASSAPAVALAPALAIAPRVDARPGLISAPTGAIKLRQAAAVKAKPQSAWQPAKGQFFVQLGAFDSAAVAKDGWSRATKRFAAFRQHTPSGMNFAVGKASYYRLSVGGFSRADADTLCHKYRAIGGRCFVRSGAGDQVAQWIGKRDVQMAAVAKPRRSA